VASSAFLISISRREQVALILGKPVYSIREVALIPLSTQGEAQEAIERARGAQLRHSQAKEDLLSDSSDDENITLPDDTSVPDPDPSPESSKAAEIKNKATSVAEDVFAKKGLYGRFTDRWFSRKGWTAEQRRKQGLSSEEDLHRIKSASKDPAAVSNDDSSQTEAVDVGDINLKQKEDQVAPAEVSHAIDATTEPQIPLLPKILTTTKVFFGSKNFYFSYDYDLSRSSSRQVDPSGSQSLHRTFDQLVKSPSIYPDKL